MFKSKNYLIILSILCWVFLISCSPNNGNIKKKTFNRLNKIKKSKKQQTLAYFSKIQTIAKDLKNDDEMLKFFHYLKNKNYTPNQNLEFAITNHFVSNYSNFYDILFIDKTGYVFHSIRQESDYHQNLFSGDLASTKLSQLLKNNTTDMFTGYEFYLPSNEPAAFFIIPINKKNQNYGWFVLQCSINKVNKLLTNRKQMGRTGEVYLVDENKLMLSESRFIGTGTILQKTIDTEAVREALEKNNGENIITDYRGELVFSSYEKFNMFGNSWIIIAEIDEAEIITDYYKNNVKYFQKEICNYLSNKNHTNHTSFKFDTTLLKIKVDMNEFAKIKPGEELYSNGISTCTAVTISYPNNFAYMAHLSPTDDIYISNPLTKFFLRDNTSDFITGILDRMVYYDIYPYEHGNIKFNIIATHNESFGRTVQKIINEGIELSQIKYIFNPSAQIVNIHYNLQTDILKVDWITQNSISTQYSSNYEDLSSIVKNIINYN